MIELLAGTASILGVLFLAAVVYAHSYRDERNDALLSLTIAQADVAALTKRVNELTNRNSVLRSDTQAQQTTIDNLRTGHDRLVAERDEAVRENGRISAELVAANQRLAKFDRPRGAKGKFTSKAAKPAAKPISCG